MIFLKSKLCLYLLLKIMRNVGLMNVMKDSNLLNDTTFTEQIIFISSFLFNGSKIPYHPLWLM